MFTRECQVWRIVRTGGWLSGWWRIVRTGGWLSGWWRIVRTGGWLSGCHSAVVEHRWLKLGTLGLITADSHPFTFPRQTSNVSLLPTVARCLALGCIVQ